MGGDMDKELMDVTDKAERECLLGTWINQDLNQGLIYSNYIGQLKIVRERREKLKMKKPKKAKQFGNSII